MAKGPIMFSKASGKLGNMVLSVNKGQQIAREYVAQPANPRTNTQMSQRIPFAACALFYKRATQAFFKFAFESKKTTESDYNAFMRINMRETEPIYPTREESQNPNFPLVNSWIMSQGSLGTFTQEAISADGNYFLSKILCSDDSAENWDGFLAENPTLQMGDIITFCTIASDAYHDIAGGVVAPGTYPPRYLIYQIIVGAPLRGNDIARYIESNGISAIAGPDDKTYLAFNPENFGNFYMKETAMAFCCVVSRNVGSSLKVSTEKLYGNFIANTLFEVLFDQQERALPTWQATGEAILQGSVAENSKGEGGTYDAPNLTITMSQSDYYLAKNFSEGILDGDKIALKATVGGVATEVNLTAGAGLVTKTLTISGKQVIWKFNTRPSASGSTAITIGCISPELPTASVAVVVTEVKVNNILQTKNS